MTPESEEGLETGELDEKQQRRLEEIIARDDERHGFNATHPELREGERFFRNAGRRRQEIGGSFTGGQEDFDEINFLSKRKGEQAYSTNGTPYPEAYPVFIGETEYKNHLTKTIQEGKL